MLLCKFLCNYKVINYTLNLCGRHEYLVAFGIAVSWRREHSLPMGLVGFAWSEACASITTTRVRWHERCGRMSQRGVILSGVDLIDVPRSPPWGWAVATGPRAALVMHGGGRGPHHDLWHVGAAATAHPLG